MDKISFGISYPPALLLLIPLLFLLWFTGVRRNRGEAVKSAGFSIPGKTGEKHIFYKLIYSGSSFLFWLSLFSAALSVSGPEIRTRTVRYLTGGNEYYIILDISPSMAVNDADIDSTTVPRIDAARNIIGKIVAAGKNDYPGLILFGNDALVAVPPTPDHDSFLKILDTARPMQLGDGTAIGTAIALAANYLRFSESERKIIFLFSDGGNNTGELPPSDAAVMAKNMGIRIYSYALGKSGSNRGVILEVEEGKRLTGYIGNSYEPQLLRDISNITGGFCFEDAGMQSLQTGISALRAAGEKERKTENIIISKSLSRLFLITGVFLLIIIMLFRSFVLRELVP